MMRYKTIFVWMILLGCLCLISGCGSYGSPAQQQQETIVYPRETLSDSTQMTEPTITSTSTQTITKEAPKTPTVQSTPFPFVEPLQVDGQMLRLLPGDDYLVYAVQQDLYIASLNGGINQKIGSYLGQSIQSYLYAGNVVQVYDAKNNTFVFYRGKPEPFEKIDEIKIKTGASCWNSVFSPDLRWQVMVCGETEKQIRLRDLQSGKEEVISSGGPGTDNPVELMNPLWSPDGQWLAYFEGDLASTLYKKNSLMFIHFSCQADQQQCNWEKVGPFIKGGEPHWGQYAAAWSPDSQQLAFITPDNPLPFEVFDLNMKTFRNVGSKEYSAAGLIWAPNGRTLIFSNVSGIFGYSLADGQVSKIASNDGTNEMELVGWFSTHNQSFLK